MDEVCPECGAVFPCRGRANIGEGTRRGKNLKTLTRNHVQLILMLTKASNPVTAHEIQNMLFTWKTDGSAMKYQRRNGEEKFWNYHDCQAQLSILVGADLVSMTEPKQLMFDNKTSEFVATPAPKYFLNSIQKEKLSTLLKMA